MKILILSLLLIQSAFATTNREGFWYGTFANKSLTDKFSYWIEGQLRYRVDQGQVGQFLYRTGLIQKLNSNHSLAYLYAHIRSRGFYEHRLALQHGMKYGSLLNHKFSHRVRFEFRDLEDNDKNATRFRYLLRADQNKEQGFSLVVWDEVFINTTKTTWNGNDSMDRNRFFLGFKYPFLSKNRMEFGYLNQYIPRDSGDISEHLLVAYLFI